MEFKKIGLYTIAAISVIGVIGLIYIYFIADGGALSGASFIDFSHDFGRLNTARTVLLFWETFWLTTITASFYYFSRRATGDKGEQEVHNLEEFESKIFKAAIAFLALAAIATLLLPAFVGQGLPHYRTGEDAVQVEVLSNRFRFTINGVACPVSDEISCLTLDVDTKYEFLLTSTDTTHGFTIYDSDNVLILQAQIVPGYETSLVHNFDETGLYHIRCAEYCGAGHQIMHAAFTVE